MAITRHLWKAPDEERQAQPRVPPPTWASHVLIPLAQNIAGGLAVWGMGLIAYMTIQYARAMPWDMDGARVWCGLAGGAVSCFVTIIRFFGDDLGLLAAAYKAGQRSRDTEIANLQLMLRAMRDAKTSAQAAGTDNAEKREQEFMQRAKRDARKLIEVHFNGDSTSRKAMETRGMGQRDWERAVRLLKAAGVMDADGAIGVKSPALALKAIDARLRDDRAHGETFTPAWK